MRCRALAGVVAMGMLGVLSAHAASVIYVPNEGTSPYAWSILANWQDDAGNPLAALPGATDTVYLSAGMAGKAVVLSVEAPLYAINVNKAGAELAIGEGGRINAGHSSYVSNGGLLRVQAGGSLRTTSYFRIGTGSDDVAGSKFLVEEGGVCSNASDTAVGFAKTGTGVYENHGEAWFGNQLDIGRRDTSSSTVTGIFDNYGTFLTDARGSTRVRLAVWPGTTGVLTNHAGATFLSKMAVDVGGRRIRRTSHRRHAPEGRRGLERRLLRGRRRTEARHADDPEVTAVSRKVF